MRKFYLTILLLVFFSNIAKAQFSGSGISGDPYIISSAEDLYNMAALINTHGNTDYQNANYLLTNDIDLNPTQSGSFEQWDENPPQNLWAYIGTEDDPFGGVFDGNGYCISGLYGKGLFGYIDGGTVRNLGLERSYIYADSTIISHNSYISEGLIMQFDGYYNTRNGHSSNTGIWEDLKGNYDLTILNYSSYTWEDNHFYGVGNGGYLKTGKTWKYFNSLNNDLTIEIVAYIDCDRTSPSYRGITGWHGGSDGTNFQNDQGGSRMQTLGGLPVTEADDRIATVSYTRFNGSFLNGVWKINDERIRNGVNSGYETVFGNSYSECRGWNDSIYAIRMYNRSLTAEEVAYNHRIDSIRFVAGSASLSGGCIAIVNSGSVINCYCKAKTLNSSGIVGFNNGIISNDYFTGNIVKTDSSINIGAVANYNSGSINYCYFRNGCGSNMVGYGLDDEFMKSLGFVDTLNYWVNRNQSTAIEYKNWYADNSNTNEGYPVFGETFDYYGIHVPDLEHVEINVLNAAIEGQVVDIGIKPELWYEVTEVSVYKTSDPSVTIPINNNTFVMPAYEVSLSVTCAYKNDHIIYVKPTATGYGNGCSWDDACSDIQWAINSLKSINDGNQYSVWVSAGTYYGDSISDHNAFTLYNGVDVYGGFAGDEPADYDLGHRDFTANATVLDGQHVQRVVYQEFNFIDTTYFDGFTVRNGKVAGEGGGMYLKGRVYVKDCVITGNESTGYGGGVRIYTDNNSYRSVIENCQIADNESTGSNGGGVYADRTKIVGCTVTGNTCRYSGGGVYAYYNCEMEDCTVSGNTSTDTYYYGSNAGGVNAEYSTLRNCVITGNTGQVGGVSLYYSPSAMTGCVITGNDGRTGKGGVYIYSNVKMRHCVVSNNSGGDIGGVIAYYSCEIDNCLVSNNTGGNTGGVYLYSNSRTTNCDVVNNVGGGVNGDGGIVVNTVVWGNERDGVQRQVMGNGLTVSHSAVTGGCDGEGNVMLLEANDGGGMYHPRFENPVPVAGVTDTVGEWSWRLTDGSALVNRGTSDGLTLQELDLDGNQRVLDIVDIGCYELQYPDNCPNPTNLAVLDVTSTSATLSWQGFAEYYKVYYSKADDDVFTEVTCYDNILTLSELTPYSFYSWGVRAYCSDSDYSIMTYGPEFRAVIIEEPAYAAGSYNIYNIEQLLWVEGVVNRTITSGSDGVFPVGNPSFEGLTVNLMNDLDMGVINWNPIGDNNKPFAGVFDGNNHKIHSFYCDNKKSYTGLFGYVSTNGEIKNLAIETDYVKGMDYVGAFAGYLAGSCLNCSNVTNSENSGIFGDRHVGGLVGYAKNANIQSVYNLSQITSYYENVGGIAGYNDNSSIINAYNRGVVTGNSIVGGIVGYYYYGSLSNTYVTSSVSGSGNNIGAVCGYRYTSSGFSNNYYLAGVCQNSGGGTSMLLENMQNESFISILNANQTPAQWKADYNPSTNDNFPILNWQSAEHFVTYSKPAHGTIIVKNGNVEIKSGSRVADNTVLTVYTYPNYGYSLISISVNGVAITGNTFTVTESVDIVVVFDIDLPELHVTSVSSSGMIGGQQATVSWTVRNDGSGATPNGEVWYDRVWLSVESRVAAGDNDPIFLGQFVNVTALGPGESYTQTQTVDIPLTAYGQYFLFVITDAFDAHTIYWEDNTVPLPYSPPPYLGALSAHCFSYGENCENDAGNRILEVSELEHGNNYHDNFFYKLVEIQVPPLPDLQVTSVMPTQTSFFSGTYNHVHYTVENKGFMTTNVEDWVDVVFISHDEVFNGNAVALASRNHHGALAPYGSYSETVHCFIPYEFWGTPAYFHVYTDVNNQVYENVFSENNVSNSYDVSVTLTPTPDLVVSQLSNSTDEIGIYDAFNIGFTVYNQGAGSTHYNWNDKLFISSNPDVIGDDKICVYTNYNSLMLHNSGVGLNHYTKNNVNVDLAYNDFVHNLDEGTYYLYMYTDADNNVFEYEADDNNITRSTNAITITKPDLTVENAIIPDTISPNHSYSIFYDLSNIRNSKVRGVEVNNRITISQNSNMSNAVVLDNDYFGLNLNGNENIARERSVLIPRTLTQGVYYMSITADAYNSIKEFNETNNSYQKQVFLKVVPLPDFTPLAFNVPSEITAGDTINVSFELSNVGNNDFVNGDLAIDIYASKSDEFAQYNSKLCETVSEINPITILSGETIQIERQIVVNQSLTSEYNHLFVVIDKDDIIFELDENNNVFAQQLTINPYPFDLNIASVTAPASCNSGDALSVSWTVENLGTKPVNNMSFPMLIQGIVITNWTQYLINPWFDYVYLSDDEVLDNNDKRLVDERHNTVLYAGDNYSVTKSISIPYSSFGNKYLLFVTDGDAITLDNERTNNVFVKPISINPVDSPDLRITNFEIDNPLYAGQPYIIRYTVFNDGDATTPQERWTDVFYLNDEYQLNNATTIGSKLHNGALAVGESYTDSIQVYIPDETGAMFAMAKTDATGIVFEGFNENNNMTGLAVTVLTPQSVDLVASQPTFDSPVTLGDDITINWTVMNQLYTSTAGLLRDAVYLSVDDQWDSNDLLLGFVESTVDIEANAQIQRSLDATMAGVADGNYYMIVRTNVQNTILESDYSNNNTVSISPVVVECNELSIGSSVNINMNDGQTAYYKIVVTDEHVGETMLCQMMSTSSDINNGLYLAHDRMPSVSSYDYHVVKPLDNNLEVVVPTLETGTYYLLAKAVSGSQSVQSIEIAASIINFEIIDVDTDRGSNAGFVTTHITGAKFDTIMDFRLKMGDLVIPAEDVSFEKSTESYATFNLKDMPVGVYQMIAELPGGIITIKDNAFTVENSVPDLIRIIITMPPSARYGTSFVAKIECRNTSYVDMNIVGYLVVSQNGHQMMTISNGTNATYSTQEVHYINSVSNGSPRPIRPGQSSTQYMEIKTNSVPLSDVHLKVFPIRLIH